jgi:gas vesicle protein
MGNNKRSDNLKRVVIGSTVAAAAGYVAGILTAPKSGKQTRGDIKAAANKSRADAEKELKKLHTELDKVIKDAKSKTSKLSAKAQKELGDLLNKAKITKDKTREVISAVHEGDAEDHDLKRAIDNAHSSIEHLREYIKK